MGRFWELVVSLKGLFVAMVILFSLSYVVGYYYPKPFEVLLQDQLEGLQQAKKMIDEQPYPTAATLVLIFVNNTVKAILAIFLGMVFGIFPIFFILFNGMLVGFLLQMLAGEGVNPTAVMLFGIMPHGMLELPIIFISAALGVKMGHLVWRRLLAIFWGDERNAVREEWSFYMERMKSTIGMITLILLAAALIETFLTPRIAEYFLV